jgi:DNA-binding NtrC family response regulator
MKSVADSLAFLLDCYGHHTAVAYDGETALRLLRTGAFEITFLDEKLPDIKGSAVAWSLRETPIRGFPRYNDGRRFVYLQKPFSCEALMQVIEDARCRSDANTRQAA